MGRPKLYFTEEERKKAKRESQRKYLSKPGNKEKQYLSNKNTQSSRHKRWRENNKDKVCAKAALERARKLQRVPKWSNMEEIKTFYKNRPKGHHVDHIIPLKGKTVSGLHVIENLQYLIAEENLSKSNKY